MTARLLVLALACVASVASAGVPKTHTLYHHGILADGRTWAIANPIKPSYEGWMAWIGRRRVTVNNVQRMRDGGTTYVATDSGTFIFPTPLCHDRPGKCVKDTTFRGVNVRVKP